MSNNPRTCSSERPFELNWPLSIYKKGANVEGCVPDTMDRVDNVALCLLQSHQQRIHQSTTGETKPRTESNTRGNHRPARNSPRPAKTHLISSRKLPCNKTLKTHSISAIPCACRPDSFHSPARHVLCSSSVFDGFKTSMWTSLHRPKTHFTHVRNTFRPPSFAPRTRIGP